MGLIARRKQVAGLATFGLTRGCHVHSNYCCLRIIITPAHHECSISLRARPVSVKYPTCVEWLFFRFTNYTIGRDIGSLYDAMGLCERDGFLVVDVLRGVDPFRATGKDSEA